MKTLEILCGILVGAVVVTYLLYLAARIIRAGRSAAEANRRIYDRYISDKKGGRR